ncbi:MAG: cell envelope integrity protein CreD [Acidobacteria bacterium]|nr:cell envelope integrity protein CreD [Acidobacteriota bacterium]
MFSRISAITFIFGSTCLAWFILGATLFVRTDRSRSGLGGRVVSSWGAPQQQAPPSACYQRPVEKTVEAEQEGRKVSRTVRQEVTRTLPLESSRIQVGLQLEHRRKGLLWYATYKVTFAGAYAFRNTSAEEQAVKFVLTLPAAQAVYDDLIMKINGAPALPVGGQGTAHAVARVPAGQVARFEAAYRSQGLDSWRYSFGADVTQVRDFVLTMVTDFAAIDFPERALSPVAKRRTAQGWELTWAYANLLSGFEIGMAMPQKLQPGPLAGEISYFAPVSLFFFFFLVFILTTLRKIELHPMNYFFLAAAFFAFHLLLAYLVDHISIHAAFLVSSAVSVFLVVSYLRLVVGLRFAAVEAGLSQLLYLVLFSYAFFFQGLTGLAITIGAILTLFVVMQLTGRVRWSEHFAPRRV